MPEDDKLQQLQLMEQSMTNLLMQKQQFESKLSEIESGLKQVQGKDKVFRIIGSIMVSSDVPSVKAELEENKKLLELRIKTIEKQEEKLRERAKSLQDEVVKAMKK
ncbi:MAG: prefoldin subunit beta [Nanoarchaeota archaeon]|nr:prefoldin subunit beta [Nanoarchaeota archaeon]